MNPFPTPARSESHEPSGGPTDNSPAQKPRQKRRPPKSPAERLFEVEAKAQELRDLLEAQRLKQREELVEELYKKFAVPAIKGDPDESERLGNLRLALGL